MKTLLLFAVLVGVALAKPTEDDLKRLTNLLKKALAKKDDGATGDEGEWPPPELQIDTTLFEGLGEEHSAFKLFGGLFADADFSKPLQAGPENDQDTAEFFNGVKEAANDISAIAQQISGEIHAFVAERAADKISLNDIAQFAENRLQPMFYSNDKANIEPLMIGIMLALYQGAIAGTEGAEKDEHGCDFSADDRELMNCVLNRAFLVNYASEVAIEKAQEVLEFDLDFTGNVIRPCDQLYNYLMASDCHKPAPAAVLGAFKATMMCLRDNINTIRDKIGMEAPDVMPGDPAARLPLPALLKVNAFLQHVGAQAYWAMETVYGVMFLPYMHGQGGEGYDKKELQHKKMVARHRFLSRTAKAYTRSKVPQH